MENYNVKEIEVSLAKITLNGQGDYIVVSTDDPTLFDRFAFGHKRIAEMADAMPTKLEEIEKQYEGKEDFQSIMEKTVAMSKENVNFSKESVSIIDGIFGGGTVQKHFRSVYEEIPSFLPDADCILALLEELAPVMEKLFNRKMERQQKASKQRMAKYQPQDHKRPSKKAAEKSAEKASIAAKKAADSASW